MPPTSSRPSATSSRRFAGRRSVFRGGYRRLRDHAMRHAVSVGVARQVHQLSNQTLLVAIRREVDQPVDVLTEMAVSCGTSWRLDAMDERMVRRLASLFRKDQFFVQLLSWPYPSVDDRDVDLGAESPHPDHLPREVIYSNPLAHLEHKDVSAVRVAG